MYNVASLQKDLNTEFNYSLVSLALVRRSSGMGEGTEKTYDLIRGNGFSPNDSFFNHSPNPFNESILISSNDDCGTWNNILRGTNSTWKERERGGKGEGDVKIFQSYFAVAKNYRSKFFIHRVALIGAEYKIIREIS